MGTIFGGAALIVAAALLAWTSYALATGMIAVLIGARYERCPTCHHHFLATGAPTRHACPHGPMSNAYRRTWEGMHHASPSR